MKHILLEDDNKISFGQWLKIARTLKGLTLRELEKISGISNPTICEIENGKANFTFKTALALANAFDIKLWKLLRDLDI